jgi:hypothetical protein
MQSTTVYVPSSEVGIWDSPNPSPASECALPPGPKVGGARSPAAKGVAESQFRRLEKKLSTLPILCVQDVYPRRRKREINVVVTSKQKLSFLQTEPTLYRNMQTVQFPYLQALQYKELIIR